jgi:hypothetical protein
MIVELNRCRCGNKVKINIESSYSDPDCVYIECGYCDNSVSIFDAITDDNTIIYKPTHIQTPYVIAKWNEINNGNTTCTY